MAILSGRRGSVASVLSGLGSESLLKNPRHHQIADLMVKATEIKSGAPSLLISNFDKFPRPR